MRKTSHTRISVVFVLLGFLLPGCTFKSGSGDIVTEKRQTGPFSGVKVSGDFDVEIKTGGGYGITVEADDNLIDNIVTEVTGKTLIIKTTDDHLRNAHFKIYVSALAVDDLKASASARITLKNILASNYPVDLDASSAGEITAHIDAPEVNAEASSGAELNLSGRTKNFKASSSSGASIKAQGLLSENSKVSTSSGAHAKVHASVSLIASASSGGNISYTGAANVKKSVSSGGDVAKSN